MAEHRSIEVREPGRVPLWIVISERLPIGRAGEGLLLTDERLSRHHCEFRVDAGVLVVIDNGSSNGTFVNGARVSGVVTLAAGDVVRLGDTQILVDPERASLDSVEIGLGQTVTGPPEVDSLLRSVVGGTITMVFSDIVDSTALAGRLGDQVWFALLQRHNEILRECARGNHGTEVKTQGDGFMLTFPSARKAVQFGIAAQGALDEVRSRDSDFVLHIRIGVHTGEVIRDSGDIFGHHVNQAARVAGQARTDEVVVSRLVHDLISPMHDLHFGEPREVELKGIGGDHLIYPVVWQ